MKRVVIFCAFVAALVVAAGQAFAAPIVLTPGTPGVIAANLGPSNCEPGCVYAAFGLANDGSLTLLYKQNVGSSESGTFASSYSTAFFNTPSDPADATITYGAGPFINCGTCLLAIKDGNNNPSYYFYNLAAWNGLDSIVMTGFWPQQGAISHVSIWGVSAPSTGAQVPAPASLPLLGTGLAGLVARRRRARQ
jgi:hypothetical protein